MRQNALCVSAYLKERKRAQAFPHGLCREGTCARMFPEECHMPSLGMVECKIDDGAEAGVFERAAFFAVYVASLRQP